MYSLWMELLWFFESLQTSFFPSPCFGFLIWPMGLVITTGFWSHLEIYWWIMIIACYYLDGFSQTAPKALPFKRNVGCHWWPSSCSYTVHPTAAQCKGQSTCKHLLGFFITAISNFQFFVQKCQIYCHHLMGFLVEWKSLGKNLCSACG